jgi:hypothetical protein
LVTQRANWNAFGSVADKNTMRAFFGAKMMVSSHMTPRSRSRM